MSGGRLGIAVIVAGGLILAAQAQDAPGAPDLRAGKSVALNICSACHVVAPDQSTAPLLRQPAPSFDSIANRSTTTTQSLRGFIANTHSGLRNPAGMPNPELTDDQTTQVVAYILSLRRHP
jgi:mono/diheme cytochrome c family protein